MRDEHFTCGRCGEGGGAGMGLGAISVTLTRSHLSPITAKVGRQRGPDCVLLGRAR